jgi:hypothetical protein
MNHRTRRAQSGGYANALSGALANATLATQFPAGNPLEGIERLSSEAVGRGFPPCHRAD